MDVVDAQVPTKATVLDLETDFGLPECVFSGCVENPQCRVVPTLGEPTVPGGSHAGRVEGERQAAARLGIASRQCSHPEPSALAG